MWAAKNLLLIHIREFYVDQLSGRELPGKTGVTLTVAQWNTLVENIKDMDHDVRAIQERTHPQESFLSESFREQTVGQAQYGASRYARPKRGGGYPNRRYY